MQRNGTPGLRLCSALNFITRGGRVADIGSDHAYLPIYLVREGYISAAIACDINEGPIQSARRHIEAAGFSSQIATLRTDGLHGVEHFLPDDILIFGMGGELIVKILSEAPWIQNHRIGLILQPMSRAAILRKWLCENGFAITGEAITFEDKYYQTVAARWCGENTEYREEELAVGRLNIAHRPPLFEDFVRHEIRVLDAVLKGKSRGENSDAAAEIRMKQKLEALL